jgi:hypothetical protein
VAATALIAAALAAGLLLVLGNAHYNELVRAATGDGQFKPVFARLLGLPPGIGSHRMEALVRVVLPAAASAIWCGLLLANLWLGLKVVQVAGRLPRPAPQFLTMRYPAVFLLAGLLSVAAGFLPDMAGRAALCFAGGIAAAYLLLGFVIVRVLTEGLTWQAFLFVLLAVAAVFFGRATLAAMIGAGIADAVSSAKVRGHRPPPRRAALQPLEYRLYQRSLTWKSFCWNASAASARWATWSKSRTATRAIFCCPRARRCAPRRKAGCASSASVSIWKPTTSN